VQKLILRKICKICATRRQILRLKRTKFDFRWGSLQRSVEPLAVFKGPTLKGRKGKGGKERERKEGVRKGVDREAREGP